MDLAAYANIGNIDSIAKANGIEVPRLRGYRVMENEKPVTDEEIKEMLENAVVYAADEFCERIPAFSMNPRFIEYSSDTDYRKERFLIRKTVMWTDSPHRETVGIRWDKIHGKRRKVLKYMIKKSQKALKDNIAAWNRYAGKENVLYIHARIGGNNWDYYGGKELEEKPWFIEKVDDAWDCTYCDIYAKADLSGVKDEKEE
jgi:hypothetical protein